MKKHLVQAGETFASLIQNYEIKSNEHLRLFHNLHCPEEDIVRGELIIGKEILIPDDPEYLIEETEEIDEGTDSMNETLSDTTNDSSTNNQKENEDQNQAEDKNDDSEHEGKHFIILKGMCQCNQGFKFPKFKVTSHQKHYWNDADGQTDYLAVTEDDLTFDPPAMPFGNCKLRPTSGGYLPCVYAPAGKWTKTYEKVKVMDKSCLTEISELMCSTGGKITIMKHGQQSEIGKTNVNNANTQEQQVYNPVVDFDEFKEEIERKDQPEAL